MNERNRENPSNLERLPFPEGFEMPTESVFRAEAERDVYENNFLFSMVKAPGMPDIFSSSEEKEAAVIARIRKLRDVLIFGEYDVQGVADDLDMSALAENIPIEVFEDGEKIGEEHADEYQMENHIRSGAYIAEDMDMMDKVKMRKLLIKKFDEAKKLATERNVSQEEVFTDQELFFQLMRRSYSPEDAISDSESYVEDIKKTLPEIIAHELRHGTLIANIGNESISVDDIDEKIDTYLGRPDVQAQIESGKEEMTDVMHDYALLMIERYWGKETVSLFD